MANTALAVDWEAIQEGWEKGVSPKTLSETYGAPVATIQKRAYRKGWKDKRPGSAPFIIQKAAQRAVAKAVASKVEQITKQVEYSVDECIRESIELGRGLMSEAKERLSRVEDGNMSGVATLARAGVDIARKSLGLDATGSGSVSCAIQFNFVSRGADAMPGATGECNTAGASPGETVDV